MNAASESLTLYHSPGACSRTQLILLEQSGAPFELRIVRLAAGENNTEEFQRLNPKGKVPVLVHQGRALTENMAIATYLGRLFPQAGLMPSVEDAWSHAQALSWLSYVATGLHPTLFRARMAQRIADGDAAQASVKARALADLQAQLKVADAQLAAREWLAADHWCAPDAYLFWACTRGSESGVDLGAVPQVRAHFERMGREPAVVRALARERSALEALEGKP